MNKVFSDANKFWNWLIVSSANPNQVSLTIRSFFQLGAVQAIFAFLPVIGIHPTFDLNTFGDVVATVVDYGLSAILSIRMLIGAVRKIVNFFVPSVPIAQNPLQK